MSDSKLHLMSFAPVPDTKTTVHVVGLPDSLRDALFTLMPPRKEGGYLNTKVLKDDLRCWLDRAVELNPVRPNVHTDSWLIALAPIDLAKLCNVIAVWISSRKDIDTQSPAYRKVMGMLHPETFEEAVRGEEIRLFSGDGRPAGRLTFPAFSAQVADAIADIPLELANGMVENFSRVSRGNGNVYELISDIHWHKEDPWAFALRFHVETLPVGRKARLNMDVAVRRFIGKPWQDDPFLKHDVNAYVRTEGGTLRVVPYGYDKQKRDLAWDPAALANYEFASGTGLPAVREYLEDMGRYARDGSQPQILSPLRDDRLLGIEAFGRKRGIRHRQGHVLRGRRGSAQRYRGARRCARLASTDPSQGVHRGTQAGGLGQGPRQRTGETGGLGPGQPRQTRPLHRQGQGRIPADRQPGRCPAPRYGKGRDLPLSRWGGGRRRLRGRDR